ncbi:MAG: ABC transporter ATP-binding protein [Atribacterota bacterium]|nr:ABC transporter ATP-binding protein [Atribacterota bacterium]
MDPERRSLLNMKNIVVRYGTINVLNKINLSLNKGEFTLLVGSNGAGKTTLLKSIIGIERICEGSIFYEGKNIASWKTENIVKKGILLIPQDGGIFRTMTVEENLQLGAYYFFSLYEKQLNMVIELFPVLKQRLQQVAGSLSGGEQRILAFGKALMSNSQILMLDEPSIGLSPKNMLFIFEVIHKLNQQGYTVLLAEQNVVQTTKYADEMYVLEKGEIVLAGKKSEIENHPRIKKAYLGS